MWLESSQFTQLRNVCIITNCTRRNKFIAVNLKFLIMWISERSYRSRVEATSRFWPFLKSAEDWNTHTSKVRRCSSCISCVYFFTCDSIIFVFICRTMCEVYWVNNHYRFKPYTYLRSQYMPYRASSHRMVCRSDCAVNYYKLLQFYELKFRILFSLVEFNFWFRSVDGTTANGWVRSSMFTRRKERTHRLWSAHHASLNLTVEQMFFSSFSFKYQLVGYFTRPSCRVWPVVVFFH